MLNYEELARMELFSGIGPDELAGLLGCLSARRACYANDDAAMREISRIDVTLLDGFDYIFNSTRYYRLSHFWVEVL